VRIAAAARAAGIITGVGYNYRWAPMVLHTRQLLETDRLGQLTNYRGRFFSMYGSDPMGLLSWRFLEAEGGYGVSSDILSHAVDLATFLVGPIAKVVASRAAQKATSRQEFVRLVAGHLGDQERNTFLKEIGFEEA